MSERTLTLIKDNDIRWVDLRFTDTRGKEQHVSIPATQVDEDFFEEEGTRSGEENCDAETS